MRSSTAMGIGACGALAVLAGWMLRDAARARVTHQRPHEVLRWEGEGGNVPEISIQQGQQGRTAAAGHHPEAI